MAPSRSRRTPNAGRVLLLTGVPGVGKTTLVRRVVEGLPPELRAQGFTTREIREGGRRLGFEIVPLQGRPRTLAHVDLPGPERVSRYNVDVAAVEAAAREALAPRSDVDLTVVDEIGKMECLSEGFVAAMRELLDSGRRVLATVAKKGGGFVAEVKGRVDVEIREITRANRDGLVEDVLRWVRGEA